ncbi:MAG: ATP-binding cassette domain-containing protein [bacterium]
MGDRLAVLGPNGSGKTTVLRTLLGEVPPLAGQVRLVPSAQIGYFDQETRQVPLTDTALRAVLDAGGDETLVRTVMGRMRIRRDSVHKPVGALSAGERAKVILTRLILGGDNLLVLDEPTNFLDVETQDVLLEALKTFPGGVVFVSHDRHFIDTLATQVLELGGPP